MNYNKSLTSMSKTARAQEAKFVASLPLTDKERAQIEPMWSAKSLNFPDLKRYREIIEPHLQSSQKG